MKKKILCTMAAFAIGITPFAHQTATPVSAKEKTAPVAITQEKISNKDGNIAVPFTVGTEVTGEGVRLRATPSLSGKVITTLSKGTWVMFSGDYTPVYADGHTWHQVAVYNESGIWAPYGWISEKYLNMDSIG